MDFCKGEGARWVTGGKSPLGVTRRGSASGGLQRKGNPGGVRLPVG